MALPLGHAVAGWSLCLLVANPKRIEWRAAALVGLLTVVADFDLLASFLLPFPAGRYWHHTVTHTFAFGLLTWVVAGGVFWLARGKASWREAGLVALLVASHTVVDYFTVDESEPRGVPLFWPLNTEFYIAAHPWFLNIQRQDLWHLLSWHNVRAVVGELLVTGPMLALSFAWWRFYPPCRRRQPGWPWKPRHGSRS